MKTEHKQAWRELLASWWCTMQNDQKEFYITAPLAWVDVKYHWPRMSNEEKVAFQQNLITNFPDEVKQFYSDVMNEVWARGPQMATGSQVLDFEIDKQESEAEADAKEKSDIENLRRQIQEARERGDSAEAERLEVLLQHQLQQRTQRLKTIIDINDTHNKLMTKIIDRMGV